MGEFCRWGRKSGETRNRRRVDSPLGDSRPFVLSGPPRCPPFFVRPARSRIGRAHYRPPGEGCPFGRPGQRPRRKTVFAGGGEGGPVERSGRCGPCSWVRKRRLGRWAAEGCGGTVGRTGSVWVPSGGSVAFRQGGTVPFCPGGGAAVRPGEAGGGWVVRGRSWCPSREGRAVTFPSDWRGAGAV